MVTYFVVNEKERTAFEKKFQVPYGYYAVPRFQTEDGAIGVVENSTRLIRENLVVERWESGEGEIIFRGDQCEEDYLTDSPNL